MASEDETVGQGNTPDPNENTGQDQAEKTAGEQAAQEPTETAGQAPPAKSGLPVYAGLGALVVIGLIDWPVAAAAALGYALARLSSNQPEPQPGAPWGSATSRPKGES